MHNEDMEYYVEGPDINMVVDYYRPALAGESGVGENGVWFYDCRDEGECWCTPEDDDFACEYGIDESLLAVVVTVDPLDICVGGTPDPFSP